MSDEQKSPEQPADSSPEVGYFPDLTPLQVLAIEMHEVYEALECVGFPDQVSAWIVASMMSDAMADVIGSDGPDGDEDDDRESEIEITYGEDDENPSED